MHRKWSPLVWRLGYISSKSLGIVLTYWQDMEGFSSQIWLTVTWLLLKACHWVTRRKIICVQKCNVVVWSWSHNSVCNSQNTYKVVLKHFLCNIFSTSGFFLSPLNQEKRPCSIWHPISLQELSLSPVICIFLDSECCIDQKHFHNRSQRRKLQRHLNTFDVVFLSRNRCGISLKD